MAKKISQFTEATTIKSGEMYLDLIMGDDM